MCEFSPAPFRGRVYAPLLWDGPRRAGLCPREMELEDRKPVVRTVPLLVSEGSGLNPRSATIRGVGGPQYLAISD